MIVMGIYRLLDVLIRNDPTVQSNQLPGGHKRIVICYPPYNYHMDPSDMVRKLFSFVMMILRIIIFRFMLCNSHDRMMIDFHDKTP
jgi:hypothetical protein